MSKKPWYKTSGAANPLSTSELLTDQNKDVAAIAIKTRILVLEIGYLEKYSIQKAESYAKIDPSIKPLAFCFIKIVNRSPHTHAKAIPDAHT